MTQRCCSVSAEISRGTGVPQVAGVQIERAEGKAIRVFGQEEGHQNGVSGICTGNHHWQAASVIDSVKIKIVIACKLGHCVHALIGLMHTLSTCFAGAAAQ